MSTKIKAVIDTNVFIHALFYNKNSGIRIMTMIDNGEIELYFARDMIGELMYILKNFAIPNLSVEEGIELLQNFASIFYYSKSVNILRTTLPVPLSDPDDEMFLKCAIKGKVDYLITNDDKSGLLTLNGQQFNIITADDFIKIIDENRRQSI